jgi:hypothetical protein
MSEAERSSVFAFNDSDVRLPMPRVRGSEIRYFKNGKCLGVAFTDIFLGK